MEELPLDVAPLVGNEAIEDAAIAFVIARRGQRPASSLRLYRSRVTAEIPHTLPHTFYLDLPRRRS